MRTARLPNLSKSRFTAGLQCLKRLYLEYNHREFADPVSESQQARFDTGTAVGELARQRFPCGVLISDPYYEHSRAVENTKIQLAAASPVPSLYEAAFTYENIRVRIDVLVESDGGAFDLVEVKSSTGVKPEHIPDVAIQLYVLENSGVSVNRAYVMHLNNQYVYKGGDYDLENLFTLADITVEAQRFLHGHVPADLAKMWYALQQENAPAIEVGRHCSKPYRCPFYGHCHQGEAKDSSAVSEEAVVSQNLGIQLAGIDYPVAFLDFETFMPALPIYAGTRPYQTIPFQWSLYLRNRDGHLSHREFLNEDADDPRERLIASLLDAIPSRGSIVVYSGYEQRVLRELAKAYPQYESQLMDWCDRLFDLLPIVQNSYRHPALPNNSLKSVVRVLVPGLGYSDLAVQEGTAASASYPRLISDHTPAKDRIRIRNALLSYCRMDTEALVRILTALEELT